MSYVDEIYAKVVKENPGETEFHQAVKEVLDSLKLVIDANEEKYRKMALLERLVEPERIISFRVPWVDDKGPRKEMIRSGSTKRSRTPALRYFSSLASITSFKESRTSLTAW